MNELLLRATVELRILLIILIYNMHVLYHQFYSIIDHPVYNFGRVCLSVKQ